MSRITEVLETLTTGWRAIVALVATIGFLATATLTAKSIIGVPKQITQHDSTTVQIGRTQTQLLQHLVDVHDKMFCIMVSDHQKTDWTKCLTPGIDP